MKIDNLIIGGGPTGLSIAYHIQGNTVVLEKEKGVGGLCRSITSNGGVFDFGGHSFHTPYPDVFELMQKFSSEQLFCQQRDARVYTNSVLIPYPFQKFYEKIPDPNIIKECQDGLNNRDTSAVPANFEEYIYSKFGTGVAKHFMLPYNRKLWARDLKRMSIEWTSERVAMPKGRDEKFKTNGGQRTPLQADTEVCYPRKGGFEEFFTNFTPHLNDVRVNEDIVFIDPEKHLAKTAEGREYHWKRLISTIPLPELLRIVNGAPHHLIELVDRLEYMSLRVEFLLAGKQINTPIQRIYVSDPEIPPHKIALNHNSSDYLRQLPNHAIMAEVSFSREKDVDFETIAPKTAAFLVQVGILDTPDDIVWTGHRIVKYAYPVYTHDRLCIVEEIKQYLSQRSIYTGGRFGDWEYINSDKCIKRGIEIASKLMQMSSGYAAV